MCIKVKPIITSGLLLIFNTFAIYGNTGVYSVYDSAIRGVDVVVITVYVAVASVPMTFSVSMDNDMVRSGYYLFNIDNVNSSGI